MSRHIENDNSISINRPHNCPFREMSEETEEIWCDLDSKLSCYDQDAFPAKCRLYDSPIIVKII